MTHFRAELVANNTLNKCIWQVGVLDRGLLVYKAEGEHSPKLLQGDLAVSTVTNYNGPCN